MRWIVTGGAGFIGSHFVRTALGEGWADEVVVLDALTYAGNLENLAELQDHPGYAFVARRHRRPRADVEKALRATASTRVIHFAAESHVDRSILERRAPSCAPT